MRNLVRRVIGLLNLRQWAREGLDMEHDCPQSVLPWPWLLVASLEVESVIRLRPFSTSHSLTSFSIIWGDCQRSDSKERRRRL